MTPEEINAIAGSISRKAEKLRKRSRLLADQVSSFSAEVEEVVSRHLNRSKRG
jgi:hypothetical protein